MLVVVGGKKKLPSSLPPQHPYTSIYIVGFRTPLPVTFPAVIGVIATYLPPKFQAD